jgi:spermidine/putrescine transport system permease protein
MKKTASLYLLPVSTVLIYLFLYIPIIVLVTFSFNDNQFSFDWIGFTTKWYMQLFASVEVWAALKNSLIVATVSMCLSISMASLLVFYGAYRYLQRFLPFFYGSIAIPEIVLAVGLLSFFSFFMIPLGITSLIAAHTILGLGYVVPIVYVRFSELDPHMIEAAYDLGATRMQAFLTVVLPLLYPAIFASALLVFIVSLDDFILSFFVAGGSTQTLPMYIFSVLRAGDQAPLVSALSTFLLLGSSLLVIIFSLLQVKKVGKPQ